MKGVIFNVVEEAVTEMHGPAAWDAILETAKLDGSYTALGNYGDAELMSIVATACDILEVEPAVLLRVLGEHMLPHLASRMPSEVETASGAQEFLLRVNDIIHPEVLKLYPDARPPEFEFEPTATGLNVRYCSTRRLHPLAAGLIAGCGRLYSEPMHVETLSSDPESDEAFFHVTFGAEAEAAAKRLDGER